MKRLGVVSHYAKQGLLIVRTNWVPSLNEPVLDKELKPVGTIKDVFGPVHHPYVAVKPRVKEPERYVGAVLYVGKRERLNSSKKKAKSKSKGTKRPKRRDHKAGPAPKRRG
ncbi:Gar1/Naf1 family protein [Thermococcus sp.]